MNKILLGSLASLAILTITAGSAVADGGPTTTVPGQVVQQTPAAPGQDVIDIANFNAIQVTSSYLASYEHSDPNLHPQGPTTCYSQWETVYEAEQFGSRIESVCFTLVLVPPLADPTQRNVMVMSNLVETFADGSKYAWGFKISTLNVDETAAHQVPAQKFDVNNDMTMN